MLVPPGRKPGRHGGLAGLIPVLVLVVLVGLWAVPLPVPGIASPGAEPDSVVADSILATVRALSEKDGVLVSRYAPKPETAAYPAYLRDRLEAVVAPMGGTAELVPFEPDYTPTGGETIRIPYTNVVARIPGRLGAESPGYFLLGAHLDATASNTDGWDRWHDPAPGADDNASGVSTILEALRVIRERGVRADADVMITFFDGEEQHSLGPGTPALQGSTWMAKNLEDKRLYGIINLDMVGYNPRADSLVAVVNVTSRWVAESLNRVFEAGAAPGLDFQRLYVGLANSDHAPFWQEGYDGVMLIEAGSVVVHNPTYHRVTDTMDNIYYATAGPGREPGSLAKKSGEMLVGLIESWAATGPSRLEVTGEDVLFSQGRSAEAAKVVVGDTVRVVAGVTNRGGTLQAPWSVRCDLENSEGFVRSLGTQDGADILPAGAHQKLEFLWIPNEGEAGSITARVEIQGVADPGLHEATRSVAVEGSSSSLIRAYVYPNPTRIPQEAAIHYELSRQGAVRFKLLDMRGQTLETTDLRYDPVVPGPNVDVGEADVRLGSVFPDIDRLAPGLYLIRVELFTEDASTSADVEVVKLAILR